MTLQELDDLRKNMLESKKAFNDAAQKFAVDNCGHAFGDIIEVNGYSHKGKKIKVNGIALRVDNWKKEYSAILTGNVLKADGTEGRNEGKSYITLGSL